MNRLDLDLTQFGITARGSFHKDDSKEIFGDMLYRLKAILVRERQDPWKIELPKSWWQMFKKQYFPAWLLKKYPVKLNVISLDIQTIYPKLKTKIPAEIMGPVFTLYVQNKNIGSFMPDTELTPYEFYRDCTERLMKDMFAEANKCPWCKRLLKAPC